MISGGSRSLSPRKQDQEGWGAPAQRTVCVNVPSQCEHSHAEPLVIWLQIPVCCDLQMLVNCRCCPDSHQPSLCCFSGAYCPQPWAATGEGGQAPVERTGQESGQTMTSLELPLHLHPGSRVNSILGEVLWPFILKEATGSSFKYTLLPYQEIEISNICTKRGPHDFQCVN